MTFPDNQDISELGKEQSTGSNAGFTLNNLDYSPVKTSNLLVINPGDNKLIEENIKQLMPNAMKKSRSSSSPFTLNNNFIKYSVNEFK